METLRLMVSVFGGGRRVPFELYLGISLTTLEITENLRYGSRVAT
jgi:hypothetical protein